MAKNTAVYGIFRNRSQAESAVDRLVENGFRTEDISVLLAENVGTKDFAHEKHPKAQRPARRRAVWSAERWAYWQASVRSPSQGLGHSSPPGRLWRRWPARGLAEL